MNQQITKSNQIHKIYKIHHHQKMQIHYIYKPISNNNLPTHYIIDSVYKKVKSLDSFSKEESYITTN